MTDLKIGQPIKIGFYGAKTLGDEFISGNVLTVEAIGWDWLVLRDSQSLQSYSVTFGNNFDILSRLES